MKEDFITQGRWDTGYEQLDLQPASEDDQIRVWLEKFVPPGNGECLEIGCFPGRYLAVLAELGYEVHGIDRTPRVTPDLRDWMRSQGHRTGEFVRGDVFLHTFDRQFDVVCSFGFIEHFNRWPELVQLHAHLVKDRGWLALSTPNFRGGLQRFLHQQLDAVNLAEHNLDAMQPQRWSQIVQAMGFEIVMCGYIGPFDLWVGPYQSRSLLQRIALEGIRRMKPLIRCLPDNVGAYAPYCGLIARKLGA